VRILITGGYGYIGGRLSIYLHNKGYEVVIGTRKPKESHELFSKINVVKIDWENTLSLEEACLNIDIIIHAAGINAHDCITNPVKALEFNGLATSRLVSAAIKVGVKRFLYFSTAHVYSSPLIGYISEETCPKNIHPYSSSHLAGENVVLYAAKHNPIECVVIRLSNAFGAPVDVNTNCWMLLVNDLCRQAIMTNNIILNTSGVQQRDFVTIKNVCRAIVHILNFEIIDTSLDIINIGGECSITVLDMAKKIQALANSEFDCDAIIEVADVKIDKDNIKGVVLNYDISKLKNTGFKLEMNFNDEIINTLRLIADK